MAIEYHKYYIETSTDSELYGTTRHLYDFMLGVSRLDNGQVQRYSLRRLSKGIRRGPATTRRHLHKLIEMGYVSCTYQKDVNNPKWNIENLYTVHPVRMQVASTFDSTPYQKSAGSRF